MFRTVLLSLLATSAALRCYEGSKSDLNGVESSNYVEKECDDQMIHCFESYNDDFTETTAACQTPNTEDKLIEVCKVGCVRHADINVTVCCCDQDLCNLPKNPFTTTVLPPPVADEKLNQTIVQ